MFNASMFTSCVYLLVHNTRRRTKRKNDTMLTPREETHDFHKSLCIFRASYPSTSCNLLKFHRDFPREAARVKARRKRNAASSRIISRHGLLSTFSRKSFSVYFSKPINSNFISGKSLRVSCSNCSNLPKIFSYLKDLSKRANKSIRAYRLCECLYLYITFPSNICVFVLKIMIRHKNNISLLAILRATKFLFEKITFHFTSHIENAGK